MMLCKSNALVAFLVLFSGFASANAQEWHSIRGNDGSGKGSGSALRSTEEVGLRIRWKKTIGSGYSSVVAGSGKVITMYTDGVRDLVICFEAQDGRKLWDYDLGSMFKGSNGSFDGPLATPVIRGESVYCLSPRGKLAALDLNSGKRLWQRDFVDEENARMPMYGFSTTPVAGVDTLGVLAGAEKGVMVGLDYETGKTKWYAGKGAVSSQIPVAMELAGTEVFVTGAGRSVLGVRSSDGEQLLEFSHQGTNGSAMMPAVFDGNKILLTNDDSFSQAFEILEQDGQLSAREFWKNRSIKNTYNVPVNLAGHFYGYSTRILTCVDEATGKPKWKSRRPGDGFLISVDGYLVLATKRGSVHLAKANPEAYEELASEQVFEKFIWAIPAYADNAIFVRSLDEIACVELVPRGSTVAALEDRPQPLGRTFEAMLGLVSNAKSDAGKREVVAKFLESQATFPIIEDGIAHFVYRGDAQDVALACDVFGARQEKTMTRVAGTDLHYFALPLPDKQRVNYVFIKDFQPQLDPLNDRTMTSSMYAGEMEFAVRLPGEPPLKMSWFGMSQWSTPDWQTLTPELAGTMVEREIQAGDSKVKATVYLPPSYSTDTDKRYPTVYVPDGSAALRVGKLQVSADQYFRAYPDGEAILVFISAGQASPMGADPSVLGDISKHVVGVIDQEYRTVAERDARVCYGAGFGSGLAMLLAGQAPDSFAACVIQSPLVFDDARAAVVRAFKGIDQSMKMHLEWGRHDMHNPVENWDVREMATALRDKIQPNEAIQFSGGMVNDSTDWPSWKLHFGKAISTVLPSR